MFGDLRRFFLVHVGVASADGRIAAQKLVVLPLHPLAVLVMLGDALVDGQVLVVPPTRPGLPLPPEALEIKIRFEPRERIADHVYPRRSLKPILARVEIVMVLEDEERLRHFFPKKVSKLRLYERTRFSISSRGIFHSNDQLAGNMKLLFVPFKS